MLPENRLPTHPCEILLEEFLNPLRLSQVAVARHIGMPISGSDGCGDPHNSSGYCRIDAYAALLMLMRDR